MTATQPAPMAFMTTLMSILRRGMTWIVQGLLAIAIIMVAGFIAIATAAAGIALALVAVFMRLLGRNQVQPTPRSTQASDGTITLEARETPRGWTVE